MIEIDIWTVAQFFAAFQIVYAVREAYRIKKSAIRGISYDEETFKKFWSEICDVIKFIFFAGIVSTSYERFYTVNVMDRKILLLMAVIISVQFFALALISTFLFVCMKLINSLSKMIDDHYFPNRYKDYPATQNLLIDLSAAFVAVMAIIRLYRVI